MNHDSENPFDGMTLECPGCNTKPQRVEPGDARYRDHDRLHACTTLYRCATCPYTWERVKVEPARG